MLRSLLQRCETHEANARAQILTRCAALPGNPLDVCVHRLGNLPVPVVGQVDHWALNYVVGLGVDGSTSEEDIAEILAIYRRAARRSVAITVSPFSKEARIRAELHARGLGRGPQIAKLTRALGDFDLSCLPEADVDVEEVNDPDLVASVAQEGWQIPVQLKPWLGATVGAPGWTYFVGRWRGAAVAMGGLHIDGDLAWLSTAATLPAYRRNGAHMAMIHRRIATAVDAGCQLVHVEALCKESAEETPSTSLRNLCRAGFEIAYIRDTYLLR
ncbi:MAG: hypothetical protein QOH16_693 [Gaiellaceae bacterium]|nr:hypothetical protein [Gaiellaceae bacterium]